MSSIQTGSLWIVATPIGHRDDFSTRAVSILRQVDVIAAEDTRHSRPLLQYYGIATPLVALHEHNEREAVASMIARLQTGESVALIADAGTPLISDPGYRLVRAAREFGIRCLPVPGPCAAIAALSVAGLPSDRFVFEGFLPPKTAARRSRLLNLASESRTLIFYESSHRVLESLIDMRDGFGALRQAVLARELTKLYESVLGSTLQELVAQVQADPDQRRGEHVIVVAGCGDAAEAKLREGQRIFTLLRHELPPAKAAKLAASLSGAPRKALYDG